MAIATSRRPRGLAAALVSLAIVFAVVVLVAVLVVHPDDAVGTPAQSRLRWVEDVFPPRTLTISEINRGGPTCVQGRDLVVKPGGGCMFILPKGVHVAVFRRVPGSPAMMVTLSLGGDLTQTVDTGRAGPDPSDPLRLRLATVHNGATITLFSCQGPAPCRLLVSR